MKHFPELGTPEVFAGSPTYNAETGEGLEFSQAQEKKVFLSCMQWKAIWEGDWGGYGGPGFDNWYHLVRL